MPSDAYALYCLRDSKLSPREELMVRRFEALYHCDGEWLPVPDPFEPRMNAEQVEGNRAGMGF